MRAYRLLDTGPLSAAANMALDSIILEEVAAGLSPPTLRFLRFTPPAVLVGYHQDVRLEVREDYCRSHGIDINRRLTGGGAIFFQESALGWELVGTTHDDLFRGSYENILVRICSIAADAFGRLGIRARFRPRNDIEVDGRKISGTGGVAIEGGYLFQGTVLVQNEIESFLKALRVPVEKLKKREIESLMERICFLSDLLNPLPTVETIKQALVEEFTARVGLTVFKAGLTEHERIRLSQEEVFFGSDAWVKARTRPLREGEPLRSLTQTNAGTLRVHLWVVPGGKRVREALICGDFFSFPQRLIYDLEAALVGVPVQEAALRDAVERFFSEYNGQIWGVDVHEVAQAVGTAGARAVLIDGCFSPSEANDLLLVNLSPKDIARYKPRWLLLPYCSKNLDCPYRMRPGCDECGQCEIGEGFEIARQFGMIPLTIQSFEHLMNVLWGVCTDPRGMYVGSCCEAFYAKHQKEMERVPARGVLVNLDSTTCYDLGKGISAYQGRFDNKTNLNMYLITKTLRRLHELNTSS